MTTIPGPGRWETFRRLFPVPFTRFPGFIDEMQARYGPVFAFELPRRRFVCINDAELIKDVLVTQQHAFYKSAGTHALRLILGEGLLTSEEPLHRRMRRIVQPAFHRARIEAYARAVREAADAFARCLKPGDTFDVHAGMTDLTLRIVARTILGSDAGDAARAVAEATDALMHEYPYVLAPLGRLRRRLPLPSTRRLNRAIATLDAIVLGLIERRRREADDRGDALSMLLAVSPESDGRPSDLQLRDEVMTLFLAGHETTANLLTWTFYLLARNQQVDTRLARAVAEGDRAYVDRLLREVMRFYPPAWIMGREAQRDVVLADGSFLAKGTTAFIVPLTLHRSPQYFPDPLVFNPERWCDWEPPPFAYVPFGGGARKCIGEEFARMEAATILEAVSARVALVRESEKPIATDPLVTLRPASPVEMRVEARVRR